MSVGVGGSEALGSWGDGAAGPTREARTRKGRTRALRSDGSESRVLASGEGCGGGVIRRQRHTNAVARCGGDLGPPSTAVGKTHPGDARGADPKDRPGPQRAVTRARAPRRTTTTSHKDQTTLELAPDGNEAT